MSVRHLEVPVMTGACSKSWGRNMSDTNAEERHMWVLSVHARVRSVMKTS